MESLKIILENQLLQMGFAVALFFIVTGILGIRVVPKYFNVVQIVKILKTASFVSFAIAILIALIFLYVIDGRMSENLELINFDSWITQVGLGAFFVFSFMWILFERSLEQLKTEPSYDKISFSVKIVTGLALVVGVFGLHGMKLVQTNVKSYDFYMEEEEENVEEGE